MIIIGLAVMLAARFFRNGKYKEVGRKSGICIGLAPLVLNYVTGAPLFKVTAWMTVTWFQNPDVFWEYLTYAMIVGEILKAPKEWKMKFDERKAKAKAEEEDRQKKIVEEVIFTMKDHGNAKARHLSSVANVAKIRLGDVSSIAKKWREKAMSSSGNKKNTDN